MKKIFKLIFIAFAAYAVAACEEKPINPGPGGDDSKVELNQDLDFTLEVVSVDANTAKVKVTTNGSTSDTWYGFHTTEVSKSEGELIQEEVEAILATGKVSGLKKQTSATVSLRGLDPQTDYKYIVFGLSSDGEVYGMYNSVEFTTTRGKAEFKENAAWTVAYQGAGTINGTEYEHTVTVTSTDKNLYFITALTVQEFQDLGIEAVAEQNLQALKDYINSFNAANGTNYKVADILFQGNGIDAFMFDPGDWYAFAIGVDEAGELTGLYAQSEVITIAEEEPTEAYAAWLGDWTITGSNGITQEVTFTKYISNKYYVMSGYEGPDADGLYVLVEWDAENELWYIYNQNLGTYDFGNYGQGDIWFLGMAGNGDLYLREIPVCVGAVYEDGTFAAIGYEEEWENEDGSNGSYKVDIMSYVVYFKSSNEIMYITGTYETGYPTFPLTFTKKAETRSAIAAKDVKVVTKLVKPYKTFGSIR